MSSISIIGLGGMARALADRALAGGHAVEVIGRDPAEGRGDRHYARRHNAPVHDDVATLEDFVRGGEGALAMVDENAVWREAESLPWQSSPHAGTRSSGQATWWSCGSTPFSLLARAGDNCR